MLKPVSAGLYVSLFVVALNIMLRRQALDTTSSGVFLTGITLMFVVITFHNCEQPELPQFHSLPHLMTTS
jgi:hypothetical protein